MKLLTAGSQPIGLLPSARKRMSDEEVRTWLEKHVALLDLEDELKACILELGWGGYYQPRYKS